MTNVHILSKHGQIARIPTKLFLEETDVKLTLYLRRAECLSALRDHDTLIFLRSPFS